MVRVSQHRFLLTFVVALALVCAGVWSVVYAESPSASGVLTFAVMDVGQGDALYVESPTGVQVLIDAGPDDSLLTELPSLMPALDRSLDAVVATHPDADHIGGFVDVLERYQVSAFVSPGIPKDTQTAKQLEEAVDTKKIPRIIARRGMQLDLGGGAVLEVLYPDRDVSQLPGSRANEGCVVMKLTYGTTSALLTCDAPSTVEARLLARDPAELDADILKVPHHGSKYSSASAFVAAVSPAVALVSVGAHNTYGHPTEAALSKLRHVGATILRTDQNGTIVCTSDGAVFTCKE